MIRTSVILFIISWVIIQNVVPQTDTTISEIQKDILQAEDLIFPIDSERLKIISAGRISKNLDELPLTVYVISNEEILRNQYTSLIDVLNSLPGITTSQPGTGELGESFQIWGLTGNLYTKILINGLPVRPSVVSGMPIGSQLPIRQADKMPVAYYERMDKFNTQEFNLMEGDNLYLFTDGYADQFGGPLGKKFKQKSLKKLLLENAHLSMEDQEQVLNDTLNQWMGLIEQVDDICVMGLKI
jgi:hypothetical protein